MTSAFKPFILAMVLMLACIVTPGYGEAFKIKELKAPAAYDSSEIHLPSLVKLKFDAVGWLDGIFPEAKRILINDQPFFLKDSASVSGLSVGMMVGAEVNQEGEVIDLQRVDPAVFEKD